MGNQISEENLDTGEIITNEFSTSGQLTKVSRTVEDEATVLQQNTYDHNGKRIKKQEGELTRYYFYDNGSILSTVDGNAVSSVNVLIPSGSIAAAVKDDSYHTYLKDIQGSTGSIVKEDGTLSAAYKYSDFGETEEITGNSFDNEICYTGQIYDEVTGLYYYNARYYDPANGRFVSQDTYRGETDEPGTWHLYAYCANNPINYVDPSGHTFIGYYDRNEARNMYVLLRCFDVTRKAISVVGGYGTLKALFKLITKKQYKKLAAKVIDEIGDNVLKEVMYIRIKNLYDKFKEGFRKGGYGYLYVKQYIKTKEKKIKMVTKKQKIINTKFVFKGLYNMKFYYSSYSRKNVLL